MKLSLSSDDKQIYKYQQNEQWPQIFEYKKDQDIRCIGVGDRHKDVAGLNRLMGSH
jgi:plasmid maintenance system killer protein